MLGPAHRLRAKGGFGRVYKHGRRAQLKNLRLFYLANREEKTRVGFVVSKKSAKVSAAAGKIVDRNRMKRILRDEAGKILPRLPAGHDIIVQAREGAVRLPSARMRDELRELFVKSGLLKM